MDWAKTTARQDEKHLSFGICICIRDLTFVYYRIRHPPSTSHLDIARSNLGHPVCTSHSPAPRTPLRRGIGTRVHFTRGLWFHNWNFATFMIYRIPLRLFLLMNNTNLPSPYRRIPIEFCWSVYIWKLIIFTLLIDFLFLKAEFIEICIIGNNHIWLIFSQQTEP